MPCDTVRQPNQTLAQRAAQIDEALERLEQFIQTGSVRIVIDKRTGALTFAGWKRDQNRGDVSDACAYRVLTSRGSAILRMAIARAETQQGVKVNARAVAMGVHSHDGGKSWSKD
jgi:hypothetical protein